MNIQFSELRGWRLFSLISVFVLAMTALAIAVQPELIQGLRSAIRATARSSFILFMMAFTASAFAVLVPSSLSKAIVRERRFIGLAFAFSHLVHAALIYAYGQVNTEFWPSRSFVDNIPGTTAYVFILLMALTSFKGPTQLLGPKAWKALHITGLWVIVAVFAFSNFKRIPMSAWYVLPFGLICAGVAIRLVGTLAVTNRSNQARQTYLHKETPGMVR